MSRIILPAYLCLISCLIASAQDPPSAPLADYFRLETERIASRPLAGIADRADWMSRRPELQRQMLEMLGLWPFPKKSDLAARVTHVVDRPDFVVETLVYQSMPGLYVTANLYRPKAVVQPVPAILYVCGHSQVEKNGVIYGNKAHYQHHAAWFAANGYVCLVLDTLQLGELPGLHHGLYREKRWWWQTRGYTPAGVEAWNAVRALDYLESRPEVDSTRMGVTGRSGGGATSWWLGAIDDRLAAVAPVAGITDLKNHVVAGAPGQNYPHGVVEGHCDCMYICNTYRWDYDTVAALVAPKPLLIENTDADPIFPEDGVRRIHNQVECVYDWYGEPERLSLVIGKGGHVDSPELRHAAFAFFEKWLKGKEVAVSEIEEPDRSVPIEQLKVLEPGEKPEGCLNSTIDEVFIARAKVPPVPKNLDELNELRAQWERDLRARVFRGWPTEAEATPLNLTKVLDVTRAEIRLQAFEFDSQPAVRLRAWLFTEPNTKPDDCSVIVLNENSWSKHLGPILKSFETEAGEPGELHDFREMRGTIQNLGRASAWVAPRGIGPTAWPADKDTQLRRRFYLLGQTLDGMRVWDVRRAWGTLKHERPSLAKHASITGDGESASIALWTSVFESELEYVSLWHQALDIDKGPALLNADRVVDIPQAAALIFPRSLTAFIQNDDVRSRWTWAQELGERLGKPEWFSMMTVGP